MRFISRLIQLLMWLCLVIGLLGLAWMVFAVLTNHVGPLLGFVNAGVWPQFIVLSIAGGGSILAAVCLWIRDRTQIGAQSSIFYLLAALTAILTVGTIVSGFMIWASRYVTF